ncbi:hypothetical protein [Streptomyces sp. NPDC058155]|uniref:hypothetical protein n=1 Tax=Streptomyces sp. NPDC058155 TaxID=3346359 RepID=UPI0036EA5C27
MSELLSFPVLAASALTQAFGFLYDRAGVILDRRAGRRSEGHAEPESVPAALMGDPGGLDFDDGALTRDRVESIESLLELLGVYHEHQELIVADDARLRRNLGRLRAVLEDVYGRQFTFEGETRPTRGVRIEQVTDDVHGRAQALKARRIAHDADVGVRQTTGVVHPGAEMIAAEIDEVG